MSKITVRISYFIMNTKINYPNGDLYEGEVDEQNLPHGKGVMKYKKQSYQDWQEYQVSYKEYKGEWEHGAKSGKGKMEYYQNGRGTMEYDGLWMNDLPNGKGKLTNHTSSTNMKYLGEWKDGLRHGFGKYSLSWSKGTFPSEDYEGEWNDDKRCGKGICRYGSPLSSVYDGEWLNDMRDGHGQWRYGNGDVVECEWKCGNKNGKGSFTFADGGSFQAEWKDNKMQMDTVERTAFSDPLLLISVHSSGFDYNKSADCLMKAKVGKFTLSDRKIVELDDERRQRPIITITAVDDEKVSYLISSDYVDSSFPVSDSIVSGEKKKYSYTKDAVAKVYDEEYDYTIENSIEIECK